MPLSWNEIRHNAIRFSKEWAGETREDAESKSFWDEFFNVFGIRRRTVASFEDPVKNIRGQYGFIDLFWSGVVLVEHKSFGKDLGNPSDLRELPTVVERVKRVKEFREKSTAEPTKKSAKSPTLFFYISQPKTEFIAIPEVSSETRNYIPMGFLSPQIIVSNKIYLIPSSSFFQFGVLSSAMHMAWIRQIAGRLESRYQYSGSMVYNNFPWPEDAISKQREGVEEKAQAVLAARKQFPGATLADLYDPLAMPSALAKAHAELDRAVDLCYRREPFESDRKRVEFLFALYEKITAPLVALAAKKPKRKKPGQ